METILCDIMIRSCGIMDHNLLPACDMVGYTVTYIFFIICGLLFTVVSADVGVSSTTSQNYSDAHGPTKRLRGGGESRLSLSESAPFPFHSRNHRRPSQKLLDFLAHLTTCKYIYMY